jgi:hypothetical protein
MVSECIIVVNGDGDDSLHGTLCQLPAVSK